MKKGILSVGIVLSVIGAIGLLCVSCTERRTASAPVPDGDTIEVAVGDLQADHAVSEARRVIVLGPEATPADSIPF